MPFLICWQWTENSYGESMGIRLPEGHPRHVRVDDDQIDDEIDALFAAIDKLGGLLEDEEGELHVQGPFTAEVAAAEVAAAEVAGGQCPLCGEAWSPRGFVV